MTKIRMDPTWAGRRRAVSGTLLSCLGLAIYSMSLGAPMATIVLPVVGTLATFALGLYVGGAAYERVRGIQSGNSYVDHS